MLRCGHAGIPTVYLWSIRLSQMGSLRRGFLFQGQRSCASLTRTRWQSQSSSCARCRCLTAVTMWAWCCPRSASTTWTTTQTSSTTPTASSGSTCSQDMMPGVSSAAQVTLPSLWIAGLNEVQTVNPDTNKCIMCGCALCNARGCVSCTSHCCRLCHSIMFLW